jgi:MFS family permease
MTAQPGVPQTDLEPIYRRNFAWFLTDNILFNLAVNIMGPTTVIPDFIRQLTRSEILIGLSSNLFEIGWTLPQLIIARSVLRFEKKKWWFVGPNLPVRFLMLIFAGLAVLFGSERPGAILAAFLVCYGLAAVGDGVVSVPWMVLIGTSLNIRWRARMLGLTSAGAGALMLLISPLVGVVLGSPGLAFPNNYAVLFAAAGLLFALSILPGLFIHELPGGKAAEKMPSMREFLPGLGHVLRTDTQFRAMIITRMLTSLFTMAGPFYIGFATVRLGLSSSVAVPTLLALQTGGMVAGALVYTWLGARSNLLVIRLALGLAAFLPISALLAALVGPLPLYFGFLAWGLTMRNLFQGYMNWVITYATSDQRPVYTGLFNTIAAITAMVAPFIAGSIAQFLGFEALFGVALAMVLTALFVTLRYIDDSRLKEMLQATKSA